MGKRIVLVSCVKSKRADAAPARELYSSALFRGMRAYAEGNGDGWYILSAEHGLLDPGEIVEPYERTLNRMSASERARWAERVQQQLADVLPVDADIVILAGQRYRESLIPFLIGRGCTVSIPLEGLSFGHQLRQLKSMTTRE